MKNKLTLLLLPLLLLIYSCDSLSESAENKAKSVKSRIESTRKTVQKNDSTYNAYLKTVGSVGEYSKKEKLQNYFPQALKLLNSADTLYLKKVQPILEKDESKLESGLLKQLSLVEAMIKSAKTTSEYPKDRLTLLKNIDDKTAEYHALSLAMLGNSEKVLATIKGIAGPYYTKYPERKEDIDKDVNVGVNHLNLIKIYNDSIVSNYNKKESNSDYSLTVLADSYNKIVAESKKLSTYSVTSYDHLKELDKSYTKILKDMKVQFYVQVGRTSWDSYSDYNTDTDYLYPIREVDETTFKYFDGLSDNVVLGSEYNSGINGVNLKIDSGMWNKLKINPSERYPSGSDDSEFWLANTIVKYYHNYIVETNGVIVEQDKWTEVDEDTFYDNLEHLGMSIVSKPLGYFEDEAMEEAAPAGMTYVGNEKYGEWKTGSNGETFWSFYGKYMFFSQLLGGNNFSRWEYDDYNKNYRWTDRHYYGSRGQHKYGTRGTNFTKTKAYTTSNYKRSYAGNTKSEFGHNNLKKSYRTQAASARTGSARRGGGPGGGGK